MLFKQDKQKRKAMTCRHKYIRHVHFGIPKDAENCVICEYIFPTFANWSSLQDFINVFCVLTSTLFVIGLYTWSIFPHICKVKIKEKFITVCTSYLGITQWYKSVLN